MAETTAAAAQYSAVGYRAVDNRYVRTQVLSEELAIGGWTYADEI